MPFALIQVAFAAEYPPGYARYAWLTAAVFTLGAVVIFALARRELGPRAQTALGAAALAFDTILVSSFILVFHFQQGTPVGRLLLIVIVEAAIRYGIAGAAALAVGVTPVQAVFEHLITRNVYDRPYDVTNVTFQLGVGVLMALIAGWLVRRLAAQTEVAGARAEEAERLRDELGRRVDLLEAANRCARALGSSLDLDQAFGAFIRELRGLVPFERMAIVLAEDGAGQVMAAAGAGAETTFPPGSARPVEGSVLEEVLQGHLVYREDMSDRLYSEESDLIGLGLRCRLAAPLLLGPRAIGMLSVIRGRPASFSAEEIELVNLLGRLVATAVQNIRSYDAERRTVEELRRLSALRADFVSLVSHELRSPMAAVIGSATTLQQRWRELRPEQRDSFLELIAGETTRLAQLVGDVLDTSRIEAGTFSYAFGDVDVGRLVQDAVAAADLAQDEVGVVAAIRGPLPQVRGDGERLRQVLGNLVENAVKYSPAGAEVRVAAYAHGERVFVDVTDRGPGIAAEHQTLIFEKFGRATADGAGKPGTGLGLFIARSIAEAHGGTLEVHSATERGATFTLALPAKP
ncbi:MAG: GAF domain-containing protein [Thermoleophilia bacterium]|nr:GAF domain-containing protein [Thermoleophilia bacterium]